MHDFWRGKRVLVTGHTGFKGSWLSLWLQKLGAIVTGYSLPAPSHPSLFEVARAHEGMRSLEGDIRDLDRLRQVFEEAQLQRPSRDLHDQCSGYGARHGSCAYDRRHPRRRHGHQR
jgi:nucleoside-diphosphate-sugar epimerase